MNWQLLLLSVLVVLPLALLGLQQYLHYQLTTKWMRLFSEKQGIPASIMDAVSRAPESPRAEPKPQHRISVPLPGPWSKPRGPVAHS